MKRKRRTFLGIEQLEDRSVPATISFTNGNLFISNPTPGGTGLTNLTVTQSAANTFDVSDNGKVIGTFKGVSLLSITGSNGADSITVNLKTFTYTGNLQINSGNGNDSVAVIGTQMNGNATLLTGAGNDTFTVSGNVGGILQILSTFGDDSATVSSPNIGGDVTLQFIKAITLSGGKIGGNVTVSDSQINNGVPFTVSSALTIGKALNVTTGAGADNFAFTGSATVNGPTTVNAGAGNDSLGLLPTALGPGLNFLGSFSYNDTGGDDVVSITPPLTGPVTVGGDMRFTFGSGNISFASSLPFTVGGNFSVNAGSGNDTVSVDANVGGSMTFNFGNGDQSVTVSNPPGGVLNWTSGNGNDTVTFLDIPFTPPTPPGVRTWNVNMRFGTGADVLNTVSLTAIPGNGADILTGRIDGGGNLTLNPGPYFPGAVPFDMQNIFLTNL